MRNWLAVGLMSGTSMDGVDAALIETDGGAHIHPIACHYRPYSADFRARLAAAMAEARGLERPAATPQIAAVEAELTVAHGAAVRDLLAGRSERPELVGFHGQTLVHRPERGWTWQVGDGAALAEELHITVVNNFRRGDMDFGGQGAPLLPVYHRAKLGELALGGGNAILNLGGVANLTWLGADLGDWISFDTGPANALLDDFVQTATGAMHDEGGRLAAAGCIDPGALSALMAHGFFDMPPPKSLDRNAFDLEPLAGLSPEDGAATLTAFTAAGVARALDWCPVRPTRLLVAGGGRHNAAIMRALAERTRVRVEPVESVGWNGDMLEAEAFAYFAVRRVLGKPITFPETTGCRTPTVCGTIWEP